ncbi:unnamed protein product, partial [Prorocentrum cordatum]
PFWLQPFVCLFPSAPLWDCCCKPLWAVGPAEREPRQMAWRVRPSFSDSIEVIQFDPECRGPGQASVAAVVAAGPRAAGRGASPPPARAAGGGAPEALLRQAAASVGGPRPSPSSPPPSPWSGGPHCSLFTEPVDSDAGEAAEESPFAKAAQRRRIRRSVTANLGPGLPPHVLPAVVTSKILSRRRVTRPTGVCLSADGSAICSAVEGVPRGSSGSASSSD